MGIRDKKRKKWYAVRVSVLKPLTTILEVSAHSEDEAIKRAEDLAVKQCKNAPAKINSHWKNGDLEDMVIDASEIVEMEIEQ